MSYQRPIYHQPHQQQSQQRQQQQQYEHYQQRLQHVPDVFPPPQAHRQMLNFPQAHHRNDVLASAAVSFNRGLQLDHQQAMSVGSILPVVPTTQPAAMAMGINHYNNDNDDDGSQMTIKQQMDASQTFPNDVSYYCDNSDARSPPRSQKILQATGNLYQVHNQDLAVERQRQSQYNVTSRLGGADFTDATVGVMLPPHYSQRPVRLFEQQQQHHHHQQQQQQQQYDLMSPNVEHDHHHHLHLHHHHNQTQQQQQQQQQSHFNERLAQNYKTTPVDMGRAAQQRQQQQQQQQHLPFEQGAIYGATNNRMAPPREYLSDFPSATTGDKHRDYVSQYSPPQAGSSTSLSTPSSSHLAARPTAATIADRYHQATPAATRYSHPENLMSGPREGRQLTDGEVGAQLVCSRRQSIDDKQDIHRELPGQLYAIQSGHLVRQDLSVNPRKISRVSISEIPGGEQLNQRQHNQHHNYNHNHHQQQLSTHQSAGHVNENFNSDLSRYLSNSTPDICRVIPSTSSPGDDDNDADERQQQQQVANQQSFARPFVMSASSDLIDDYPSSYDDSPTAPLSINQSSSSPPPQPETQARQHNQQQDQQRQAAQQGINFQKHQKQIQKQQQQQSNYIDMRSSGTVSQDWLDMICTHMIEHMNNFGICVIDNFLGSLKGEAILSEVLQLYRHKNYTTGRLVSDKRNDDERGNRGASPTSSSLDDAAALQQQVAAANLQPGRSVESQQGPVVASTTIARTIRNDRVIWVDGCEDGCSEINNLIQTLCSVITNSSRLSLYSGNTLDKIVINKRTKAHVACYPGNQTRYIKHVDNPNNDGRVITAIYYLNKDWNTKRDGGLLRMFPAGMDTVANIEPLFDRVLFFWSDRRNPHEVLPAFRDRFAITVWYIGSERD